MPEMFVFHKECVRGVMPPQYYVVKAADHEQAAITILENNNFEPGCEFILKFVTKHYKKILDEIPPTDPIFYPLEDQGNLEPFSAPWWNQTLTQVTLPQILDAAIKYEAVTPAQVYNFVKKQRKTSEWIHHIFPVTKMV